MTNAQRFVLCALACGLAILLWGAAGAGAQERPTPPQLIFPFPEGQTWLITCGYTLPEDAQGAGCGHSGSQWNRYALDLQHAGGPKAAQGQPVLASAAGVVSRAGWQDGFGWHVLLDHGSGYSTVYAHMERRPAVTEGAEVVQGQLLGRVGCTGHCTGPHIHFALWKDGVSVLPEPICGLRRLGPGQLVSNCGRLVAAGVDLDGDAGPLPLPVDTDGDEEPEPAPVTIGADFDGDGRHDAAFLYKGVLAGSRVDLLASSGEDFDFTRAASWPPADGQGPLSEATEIVTGDFDGDGRTDLAGLAPEPECPAQPRVLLAEDEGFAHADWWSQPDFCSTLFRRAAAGDFNGDGLADMALLSQWFGRVRIDVLYADGEGFAVGPDASWRSGGDWLGWVTDVLPGDFDGDGRADLAVLSDVGGCMLYIHVFRSSGETFELLREAGWWPGSGGCASGTPYAASGDFDGDGLADDVALLSETGPGSRRLAVLRFEEDRFVRGAAALWWEEEVLYPPTEVHALVPGDFDGDGRTDLALLADNGECVARTRVLVSQGDGFEASRWWWSKGNYCAQQIRHTLP